VDTVALIKVAPQKEVHIRGPNFGTVFPLTNPLPQTDEWTMLPDGAIAIVRGHDYHVDILEPDGRMTTGPRLPFDWKRITREEKQAIVDSLKRQEDERQAKLPPPPPPERVVCLDDHPQLAALLARPLCGEARAAYAYVAAANRPAFETYVGERLAHCVDLRRSADLIAAGWFGPPPAHPKLAARVGDYTLLMKDNWTIKDWLPGEKHYRMLGVHGGTSADEMRVPLVAVRV